MWLHSSVGRASHRYRGGHGFESHWTPDFFQASSFQLLKLDNLLRWSFCTLIYNGSSIIWIIFIYELFSYILHSRNPAEKRKLERFYYHFFVWLLKILWQVRVMAFRNEHPEWDQNPWFVVLTDSSETKSILDFSICLSLSPPGKTVCYRKRRIHDERASQFFSALHSIFLLLKPQIVEVCKSI